MDFLGGCGGSLLGDLGLKVRGLEADASLGAGQAQEPDFLPEISGIRGPRSATVQSKS